MGWGYYAALKFLRKMWSAVVVGVLHDLQLTTQAYNLKTRVFVGLLNPKNRISLDSDIVRPSLSEGLGNSFVRQWRRFADYPARRSAVFWKDSEAGLCGQPNPQNIAEKWNYSWQFTSPKNHRQRSKRWPKIWLGFNCWKRADIVTCGHGVSTGFGKTSCLLVKFPYNAFMILLKAKNASQKQFGKNEKNGELPAVFTAKKTTPISVAFKDFVKVWKKRRARWLLWRLRWRKFGSVNSRCGFRPDSFYPRHADFMFWKGKIEN